MVRGIVERVAHDPTTGVDLTRIVIQVWAETTRNPALHARTNAAFLQLRDHCTEIVRRWQAAGNLPADVTPEHAAAAIIGMAQGFWLQRVITSSTSADDYLAECERCWSNNRRLSRLGWDCHLATRLAC